MKLPPLTNIGTYARHYVAPWLITIAIWFIAGYMEKYVKPFHRMFHLTDPAISYPFTKHQRFTSQQLWVWAIVLPYTVIIISTAGKFIVDGRNLRAKYIHLLHITTLAFLMSLSINGFVTEFLKINIGKMRPDFLERCGASISVDDVGINEVFDSSICTKPLGEDLFNDGYKSDPSGHSSFAWCGLTFLNLWLSGQFELHSPIDQDNNSINSTGDPRYHRFRWLQLINLLPLGLCLKIAISRSEDYRHDFIDIGFGSLIGFLIAVFVYSQYFRSIFGYHCQETKYGDYKELESGYEEVVVPV